MGFCSIVFSRYIQERAVVTTYILPQPISEKVTKYINTVIFYSSRVFKHSIWYQTETNYMDVLVTTP